MKVPCLSIAVSLVACRTTSTCCRRPTCKHSNCSLASTRGLCAHISFSSCFVMNSTVCAVMRSILLHAIRTGIRFLTTSLLVRMSYSSSVTARRFGMKSTASMTNTIPRAFGRYSSSFVRSLYERGIMDQPLPGVTEGFLKAMHPVRRATPGLPAPKTAKTEKRSNSWRLMKSMSLMGFSNIIQEKSEGA